MADLFLVATSARSGDYFESKVMQALMQNHCNRFFSAGETQLSRQSETISWYAFFLDEFLTKCGPAALAQIAEKMWNISQEEFWELYKQWSSRDDKNDQEVREWRNQQLKTEKEMHGHESLWPRAAWVLERQSLRESKE